MSTMKIGERVDLRSNKAKFNIVIEMSVNWKI